MLSSRPLCEAGLALAYNFSGFSGCFVCLLLGGQTRLASTNRAVSLYPCAIQCQQIEVKSAQRGGDLITWIRIRYVAETYAVPSASSNKQVNLVVTSTFGSHRNTYNFKVISTADSFSSQSYSYIPPQSFFTAQLSLAGPSLRIIYLSKITDLPPKQDLNMMLPNSSSGCADVLPTLYLLYMHRVDVVCFADDTVAVGAISGPEELFRVAVRLQPGVRQCLISRVSVLNAVAKEAGDKCHGIV